MEEMSFKLLDAFLTVLGRCGRTHTDGRYFICHLMLMCHSCSCGYYLLLNSLMAKWMTKWTEEGRGDPVEVGTSTWVWARGESQPHCQDPGVGNSPGLNSHPTAWPIEGQCSMGHDMLWWETEGCWSWRPRPDYLPHISLAHRVTNE